MTHGEAMDLKEGDWVHAPNVVVPIFEGYVLEPMPIGLESGQFYPRGTVALATPPLGDTKAVHHSQLIAGKAPTH